MVLSSGDQEKKILVTWDEEKQQVSLQKAVEVQYSQIYLSQSQPLALIQSRNLPITGEGYEQQTPISTLFCCLSGNL